MHDSNRIETTSGTNNATRHITGNSPRGQLGINSLNGLGQLNNNIAGNTNLLDLLQAQQQIVAELSQAQ